MQAEHRHPSTCQVVMGLCGELQWSAGLETEITWFGTIPTPVIASSPRYSNSVSVGGVHGYFGQEKSPFFGTALGNMRHTPLKA